MAGLDGTSFFNPAGSERRFSGHFFKEGGNKFNDYLTENQGNLQLQQNLGLQGSDETASQQDAAWGAFMNQVGSSLPPAYKQWLSNRRSFYQTAYNDARATQDQNLRFANFLAGLDTLKNLAESNPKESGNDTFAPRIRWRG